MTLDVFYRTEIIERYEDLSIVTREKNGDPKESGEEAVSRVIELMDVIGQGLEQHCEGFDERLSATVSKLDRLVDTALEGVTDDEIREVVHDFKINRYYLFDANISPAPLIEMANRIAEIANALLSTDQTEDDRRQLHGELYTMQRTYGSELFYDLVDANWFTILSKQVREWAVDAAPVSEENPENKKVHEFIEELITSWGEWGPYIRDEAAVSYDAMAAEAKNFRQYFA